jgi:hypothetical protein
VRIRDADPARDAAACAAIYAPSVVEGVTSFEESGREVFGYAYACPHRERTAYRWAVDVSVYVATGQRGRGHGRSLYEALSGGHRAPAEPLPPGPPPPPG